jgi:hypothetical protein
VRGWGDPDSDDWRKSITLFLLCGFPSLHTFIDGPSLLVKILKFVFEMDPTNSQRSDEKFAGFYTSVADPDPNPDPSDPYVFGPPGSGSISQWYGSGSRSFYHHAKIVRKTLIPTVL